MQVLQLSFSWSISCAALSESGNKRQTERERAVSMSSSFYDFKLYNRSEGRDLHDFSIKQMLYLSKCSRVTSEALCPISLHDEC